MAKREFHYRWEYALSASPQALWPFVTDTNRFNRDAGLPDVTSTDAQDTPGKNNRRRLRLSKLGVGVEWEEEPFEWVRPFRFGVVRRYKTGPVAEARGSRLTVAPPASRTGIFNAVRRRTWDPWSC